MFHLKSGLGEDGTTAQDVDGRVVGKPDRLLWYAEGILMNHARIGSGSIIGAGALVTERTEIPAGSLVVGAPAQIIRPTTGAERARIRVSAAHYLAMGARHRTL